MKDLSTGVKLLQGQTKNELYEWPVESQSITGFSASSTPKTDLSSWHSRLGHPSLPILKAVVSQFSLPISHSLQKQFSCSDCFINKSHKLPFFTNTIVSHQPLEYVYFDVWTSPMVSVDNFKYYLVLVDHFTRYTWLYPLKQKSQVKEVFVAFKAVVENRFQRRIRTLYSDNGGEFIALRSFLVANGISHLTSPPHTPEHNGISERKHRHIVETDLSLLTHASVPKSYWTYAFAAAVYEINRMPTEVGVSPYAKLFQKPLNYLKLRVFGCLCFPWLRPYTMNKLDNRSLPCAFIGYSLTQSAYLCLDITTGRIYTSRHVQFVETSFPFATSTPAPTEPLSESSMPHIAHSPLPCSVLHPSQPQAPESSSPLLPLSPPSSPMLAPLSSPQPELFSSSSIHTDASSPQTQAQTPQSPIPSETQQNSNSPITKSPIPQISSNTSQPTNSTSPTHVTSSSSSSQSSSPPTPTQPINPPPNPPLQNEHPMRTRAKNQITKPKTKMNLLATKEIDPYRIPTTVAEALKYAHWREAMSEEINAQLRNNT